MNVRLRPKSINNHSGWEVREGEVIPFRGCNYTCTCRYVQPQRVQFFSYFGHKWVSIFAKLVRNTVGYGFKLWASMFFTRSYFSPREGEGVLNKALYGEAPPRCPTPYPFIYHFGRKGTPFIYLLLTKGTPFTYLFWEVLF